MSKYKRQNKLFDASIIKKALKHAFFKLSPEIMIRNPVMFTV